MRPVRDLVLLLLLISAGSCAGPASKDFDVLLAGGTVVDGSGADRFRADVAFTGDRIVAVEPDLDPSRAKRVVDASGLVLAPGFLDSHAHTGNLAEYPDAENFVRQGITTTFATLHSQDQPYPLSAAVEEIESTLNIGFFAGHTWMRRRVLGEENREATPAEMAEMAKIVEQAMEDGALGLSTGLEYVPAFYSTTKEIVELARVAATFGGVYTTHMRDEGPGLLESIEETIHIAERAGLPALVNHHKILGAGNVGRSADSVALIEAARDRGVQVSHDLYPYTAYSTYSSIVVPQWALAGGPEGLRARAEDPATRRRILEGMASFWKEQGGRSLQDIQFRDFAAHPEWEGKRLQEYVVALQRERGSDDVSLEAGLEILLDLELEGGFIGIFHAINEEDLITILQHPPSMIETDGDLLTLGEGHPHPRSLGSFPRVLARYVRELGVLSLEQAIHKMTQLPARFFGQSERGCLAPDCFADVVLFDPLTVQDRATYTEPHQYATGVVHVFVNGEPVLEAGELTGRRPGRVLQRAENRN